MLPTIRNILVGVLFVVLGGLAVYAMYINGQNNQSRQELYDELAAEARPYEVELYKLEEELSSMGEDITYTSSRAKIVIGFVLSNTSDIRTIEELSEKYGFSPVVILDCANEYNDILPLANSVTDTGWEIMLTAAAFSDEANENIVSVLNHFEEIGADQTGIFLLRNDSYI